MSRELPERCQYLLNLQHGVIARWQAPLAGLGIRSIENLVRYGRWQRLHRGIYAGFAGKADRHAQLWAAVLRVGSQAILSHQSAAEVAGLADMPSQLIHVTVPAHQHLRPVPGIVLHRSRRIATAAHPSLLPPQTMIEETVLDLTQEADSFDEAFSWVSRACQRELTTPALLRMRMDLRKKMRWRDELSGALSGTGVRLGHEVPTVPAQYPRGPSAGVTAPAEGGDDYVASPSVWHNVSATVRTGDALSHSQIRTPLERSRRPPPGGAPLVPRLLGEDHTRGCQDQA